MRVLLALSLLLLRPVADEPGVSGYVLAPDGLPVSSGTVAAQAAFGRTSASIDRFGRFRFAPPRPGPLQVVVSVPGFVEYRLAAIVPASRSLRLPVIHLQSGSRFRVRFVTPDGEPILAPVLRRRVFDTAGNTIADGPADGAGPTDFDGAITIGPLPRGIMAVAVDLPFFAQTRLPDVSIGAEEQLLDGGTIVIQRPGATLHVDVVDAAGEPVPNHDVFLEDPRPRSPLAFEPAKTDPHGRATFDRLAAGRYRVRSTAIDRCGSVWLPTFRDVPVPASGTTAVRLAVGGRATFSVTSPLGPVRSTRVSAEPDVPRPPSASAARIATGGCPGVTDADGRVTLENFPPGPAHVDVRFGNSTYERRVVVPIDGREVAVTIPDGFLPVRVVNAVTGQPLSGATVTWTGSGGRAETTTTATGEALIEAVGTAAGTLAASARGFQQAEEALAEPPGVPHTLTLTPLPPPANVRVRVTTASGQPLADAVVALFPTDPSAVPRVMATDAKGVATFADVPAASGQVIATAGGFAAATLRFALPRGGEVLFALSRGYRVVADVAPADAAGPQRVRVIDDARGPVDDLLDLDSDRALEPPGRLSIGPLAPGAYIVQLDGPRGRRQQRVRLADGDASVAFR